MKRNLIKVFTVIICIFLLLIAASSVFFGHMVAEQVLHPNRGVDTHDNSVKQLAKWGYDLDGFMTRYTGEEISAEAEDGNIVPATYFSADSDTCVVLVHGAGGDRVSVYPLAEAYLQRGYDVIALDQRGCGANPDEEVTFGIDEALDVRAMVTYARTELGAENVLVHGQSMGGQTAALYASGVTPGEVNAADAVICDSPVPGMEYMVRSVIGEDEEGTDSSLCDYLIATSNLYMKLFYGVEYAEGDTIAQVAMNKLPMLIIVSDQDEVCLPHMVEKIYDNITYEAKEIQYVNGGHIEGIINDPEGYMNGVEGFLNTIGF
ncbi:MAG: alpha/beta hydrolase [Lachnospiraceae bacterium]|nr:alpha/beta hydrolase [Lachnospiraceae bacterium]